MMGMMLMLMGMSTVNGDNGIELSYQMVTVDTGMTLQVGFSGTGPNNVLFLHGFPEGSAGWADVIPYFDSSRFTLIVPDQRGFNVSSRPLGVWSYNTSDLAADLASLIRIVVPTQRAYVVSHDWGGPISWILASKYPQLVRGLVVMDGPHPNVFEHLLRNDPEQKVRSQYVLFFNQPSSTDYFSKDNFKALIGTFGEPWMQGRERFYLQSYSQPRCVDSMLNWYRANIYGSSSFDDKMKYNFPPNLVISPSVPVTVLWGGNDSAFNTQANLDGIAGYVRGSLNITVYDGVGHWIAHNQPARVANDIITFINLHP